MAKPFQPSWYRKPNTVKGGLPRVMAPSWYKPPSAPSVPALGGNAPSAKPAGGPAGAGGQTDPRDAQYFNDVAKLQSNYVMRRADLQAAGQNSLRNYNRNLGDLNIRQPKDMLGAREGANNAGLFYSGTLGKNLGEIESSYARRKSQLAEDYQSSEASRLRGLQELDANNALGGNDALYGAIGRQTERDAANPIIPPGAAVSSPVASGFTRTPGTSKSGVRGEWHIYPNGRKVFVRR